MKRILLSVVAVLIAAPLFAQQAETHYRDLDVSWKNLGSNYEERTQTAKEMSTQNEAYVEARDAAKEAMEAKRYKLAETKYLEAASLSLWSRVAAWHYNNAAYAIILGFEAREQIGNSDLVRARGHLKKAGDAIADAKICDICREQLDHWDKKTLEAEATILKNEKFIEGKIGIEKK